MIQRQNNIVGIFLLLCFALAIIPAELFHEHDWKSEVCQESELHFSNHSIDCDLADFFIAKHLRNGKNELFSSTVISSQLLYTEYEEINLQERELLKLRGPPRLS